MERKNSKLAHSSHYITRTTLEEKADGSTASLVKKLFFKRDIEATGFAKYGIRF
jgi:hypothetical protein